MKQLVISNPLDQDISSYFRANPLVQGKVVSIGAKEEKTFEYSEGMHLLRIYGMNQVNPEKFRGEGFLKLVREISIEPVTTQIVTEISSEQKEEQKKYVCKECGKDFKAKIGLAGHMRSHK